MGNTVCYEEISPTKWFMLHAMSVPWRIMVGVWCDRRELPITSQVS
jgi:membrane protein CcdC involved in cytochrome C biogenesis